MGGVVRGNLLRGRGDGGRHLDGNKHLDQLASFGVEEPDLAIETAQGDLLAIRPVGDGEDGRIHAGQFVNQSRLGRTRRDLLADLAESRLTASESDLKAGRVRLGSATELLLETKQDQVEEDEAARQVQS